MMRFASFFLATERRRVRPDAGAAPQGRAARRGRAERRHEGRLVRGRARRQGQGRAGRRTGKGPDDGAARSVSEAVDRIKLDYEGEPYFLTGRMDAGCCQ